jgi:hypothetical protein
MAAWGVCRSAGVWRVSRAIGVRGVGWVMVLVERVCRLPDRREGWRLVECVRR